MSIFGKVARLVAYPVLKPIGSMRDAATQIKEDLDKVKAANAKLIEKQEEEAKAYLAVHAQETPEQLLDPSLILDPRRRFEVLVELRGWTEPELDQQFIAARRGKRFASICAAVLMVSGFATLIFAKPLMQIFIAPAIFAGCVWALASAFKYGLYQFQLELRSIVIGRFFIAQPDFFKRVAW